MPENPQMPENQRIEEFLSHLADEKQFSGNTLAAYRNDLTQFRAFLEEKPAGPPAAASPAPGPYPWATVTQTRILDFLLYLKERSYATSTVARKIAAVKSFFHWLRSRQLIVADPTTDLGVAPRLQVPAASHLRRQCGGAAAAADADRLARGAT